MTARLTIWRHVTVSAGGSDHTGSYAVEKQILHVHYKDMKKATQIGGSDAYGLARLLLFEMVAEAKPA